MTDETDLPHVPRPVEDILDDLARRSERARYGRPWWLVERDDDEGLTMLGRGEDE